MNPTLLGLPSGVANEFFESQRSNAVLTDRTPKALPVNARLVRTSHAGTASGSGLGSRRGRRLALGNHMDNDGAPFACLYGCTGSRTFNSEYHVLSKSATSLEVVLQKRFVCDDCNKYFSTLENHFVQRHPGSSTRLLAVKKTRKGKTPKFESEVGTATRQDSDSGSELKFPLDSIDHEFQPNGDIKFTGKFRPKPFDSHIVSRLLAKIALESLVQLGRLSPLWPYNAEFDPHRNYVRHGSGKIKFLWFA